MKTVRAANALLRSTTALSVGVARTTTFASQAILLQDPRHSAVRPFSTTPPYLKKKDRGGGSDKDSGKGAKNAHKASSSSSSTDTSAKGAAPEDPFDLADLTAAFDKADQKHGDVLKQIRQGGRFSAEALGALAVQPDRKSPQTFPLRELATVAPVGGRRWSILAFEEASVGAISSAVQRSEAFNQQPQRGEENPLELVLTVEPERADEVGRRVKAECQLWRDKLRDEAHRREKVHKKWRADGVILADDLARLKTMVQKLQDDRMKVVAQKEKELLQFVASKS